MIHSAAWECMQRNEGTPFPTPYLIPTLPGLQEAPCDSPWQGCSGTLAYWAGHSKLSLQLPLSRTVLPARAVIRGASGGPSLSLQGTRLLSDTCPTRIVPHVAFCPETKRLNDSSKTTQVLMVKFESRQHIS